MSGSKPQRHLQGTRRLPGKPAGAGLQSWQWQHRRLPGQSIDEVLDDLLFAGKFSLAMVSCSAFIPGEGSKLHDALSGNPDDLTCWR